MRHWPTRVGRQAARGWRFAHGRPRDLTTTTGATGEMSRRGLRILGGVSFATTLIVCGLLVSMVGAASSAPAFVQQVSAHSLNVTRLTLTPSSNVTSGNRIVVLVGVWSSSSATASSVTDAAGNTYTEILHFKASDATEMSVWTG